MEIIVAKNSGFCFGVKEAINTTMNVLDEYKEDIYSLGPLIHNNQAIERLEELGLSVIDNVDDINYGKIIIRSHGVPLDVYKIAEDKDIELIDCTCPFVRKIQKKARDCYDRSINVVIIGDPNHPEVIGINGWCGDSAYIINNEEDVEAMPELENVCVVAQTTMTSEKFNNLSKLIDNKSTNTEICNTICNATKVRQNSCEEVAKKADAMIVIGGYHSSNTQKLVEISKKYCGNVYHVETVDELPMDDFKDYETVGITAGASTPTWIIEEVINKMEELLEDGMVSLDKGDIVEGEVITVGEEEVVVNVNYKADGIISKEELSSDTEADTKDIVSVGDKIDVLVLDTNDGEGNVVLSKKQVDNEKTLNDLETSYENGEVVSAKVNGVVKGGVTVNLNGIRGFIPASQVSNSFIKDLETLVGETLDSKIIEFDKSKNNIVLSRKEVEAKEDASNKEKVWSNIKKGQKIKGEVKRLTNFGAFIDIGGIDGLAHISELSWSRVENPSEVLNVGDEIEVLILNLDEEKERVSLGVKQLTPHPWDEVEENYKEQSIVEGKIVRILDFGAFVELEPGIDGLVHISEISDVHIEEPGEVLKVGETVKVKILNIDADERKMGLSIKEADPVQNEAIKKYSSSNDDDEGPTIGDRLGDIFK